MSFVFDAHMYIYSILMPTPQYTCREKFVRVSACQCNLSPSIISNGKIKYSYIIILKMYADRYAKVMYDVWNDINSDWKQSIYLYSYTKNTKSIKNCFACIHSVNLKEINSFSYTKSKYFERIFKKKTEICKRILYMNSFWNKKICHWKSKRYVLHSTEWMWFILIYFLLVKVLHVIDDILTPLTVNPSATVDLNNPDAFQFLSYSDSLDIGGYRLR